jgi:hypothetical protein
VIKNPELLAVEFLGPVTLFTSFICRPKVVNRRLDRLVESAKRHGIKLVHAVQLRPDIPLRASANVALDATDSSMRGRVIRDKFRFHHVMTLLAAKRNRLGIFVCPIASESAYEQKSESEAKCNDKGTPTARII